MGRLCLGLITGVCVLFLLSGCDPTAEEQRAAEQEQLLESFEPSFASASGSYEDAMRDIRTSGQGALAAQDQDAVIAVYRELQTLAADAADDFAELTPPAAVRDRHNALVENLRDQARVLGAIVSAADASDDPALTTGLTELASLFADFTTIHSAIDNGLAEGS